MTEPGCNKTTDAAFSRFMKCGIKFTLVVKFRILRIQSLFLNLCPCTSLCFPSFCYTLLVRGAYNPSFGRPLWVDQPSRTPSMNDSAISSAHRGQNKIPSGGKETPHYVELTMPRLKTT
ncbi:hypothetical protein CYLTODRAFT_425386 [Cylindrobasidium torrendii FP15055 ss-10]|uniref:Uncharacterized protein n=1 Tax=Cylindrobasidium torrendii FP15055 ss-10 TaxID=1314674 RepID=A0A0D7B279_9AGAR|nr:hypothetical protein CYLTODRAFT_425386 [Cylindrobasidium torrendii FP15055 ss-10]